MLTELWSERTREAFPTGAVPAGITLSGFPQYADSVVSLPRTESAKIGAVARQVVESYRPGRRPVGTLCLVGHADRDLRRGRGFELIVSAKRARSVQMALVSAIGDPGIVARLHWQRVAAGAEAPVVSAPADERARAANRRVEIWLIPELGRNEASPFDPAVVRWVQGCANRLTSSRLATNGVFGGATYAAVRRFQAGQRLPATGIVGPATFASLVRVCGLPATALLTAPPLSYTEDSPKEVTHYVKIVLGGESPAAPLTGIFVPKGYRVGSSVDLILYLHGHHKKAPWPPDLTIDRYWSKYRYWWLRESLVGSGRNAVLVAPTLGPASESGWLAKAGGLERYVDLVRAALGASHGPYQKKAPALGSLILACHSGGGAPMLAIAGDPGAYQSKIEQCWGFDCLYNKGADDQWVDWAKAHRAAKLFVHYGSGGTETMSKSLAAKAAKLGLLNVSVGGDPTMNHNEVPIRHWRRRLKGAWWLGSTAAAPNPEMGATFRP